VIESSRWLTQASCVGCDFSVNIVISRPDLKLTFLMGASGKNARLKPREHCPCHSEFKKYITHKEGALEETPARCEDDNKGHAQSCQLRLSLMVGARFFTVRIEQRE